jgi:hypothetical protein
MRHKRRNPRQSKKKVYHFSVSLASNIETCFGSEVHKKQRKLFRGTINSATSAIRTANPPPPPPPPPLPPPPLLLLLLPLLLLPLPPPLH